MEVCVEWKYGNGSTAMEVGVEWKYGNGSGCKIEVCNG